MTYDLTQQEKGDIRNELYFYSGKKTTVTELTAGTFNGNHQLARQSCGWETRTGWNPCSSGDHDGSNFHECEYVNNLSGGTPPTTYSYSVYICEQDKTLTSYDPTGGGSGGGGAECDDFPPPTIPTECIQSPDDLSQPSTGISEDGGCIIGIPTLPNLGNPKNDTLCTKTQNLLQSSGMQEKIDGLKQKAKTKGEQGYNVDMNGVASPIIDGGDHEVNLGDAAGQQGGHHNHTPTGIKMHSPPDILKLFTYAMNFNNGNTGDAYFGMIGADICSACTGGYKYYHYIIRFNGTYEQLANLTFSNWDETSLMSTYQRKAEELSDNPLYYDYQLESLKSMGLEKLFFDTIKNMGIENKITLQRIDDDGTVQNITLENNEPKATPCP